MSGNRQVGSQQAMASTKLRTNGLVRWARWPWTWALAGALLCAGPGATTEAAVPGIEHYLGRSRVLLLFAPRADNPALVRQRAILSDAGAAMSERDLVAVEVPVPRGRRNCAAVSGRAPIGSAPC